MTSLSSDEIIWISLLGVIVLMIVIFALWYFVYGRRERKITNSMTFLNAFNDLDAESKKKVLMGVVSIVDKEDEEVADMKRIIEEQKELGSNPVPPVQNMQQFKLSDMLSER